MYTISNIYIYYPLNICLTVCDRLNLYVNVDLYIFVLHLNEIIIQLKTRLLSLVLGELVCDFPPAPLYYGILGNPVFLHVPILWNTRRFSLIKANNVLLNGKREDQTSGNVCKNGVELFSSGSVKISRCEKNHSGEYHWETFDSDGDLQCSITFTLQIYGKVAQFSN